MISLPTSPFRAAPLLNPASRESLGIDMARYTTQVPTSQAWGTANTARFVPYWIPEPVTVVKLYTYNGTTASGTTDMGLFDELGNALISIAAATQAGTSAIQEFDVADTLVFPGLYYVGLLSSSATATFFGWPFNKEFLRAMGCYSQAVGSANLPNPATFAAYDASLLPVAGIALRSLI